MFNPADDCSTSAAATVALSVTALAAILAAATQSAAEPLSPLTAGLLGSPASSPAPRAERFATPDGAVRFTLDRSSGTPLMKIDGKTEVLALRSSPGPRGDEFLKTDTGRLVLRVTSIGGMTIYPDAMSGGAPVSLAGAGRPVALPAPPQAGLAARLGELSRDTSEKLGRSMYFETAGLDVRASALAAEAAARAAEALVRRQAAVSKVVIVPGIAPSARLDGNVLRITVVPGLGYGGRPSADAVAAALP